MRIFQSLLLHSFLAFGARFPFLLPCLIAPNMDIFRGEELHHLCENPFEKGENAIVTRAEVGTGIGLSLTSEVGISREHLVAMARHFNLWNNGDVLFSCISHDVAHFVLCVISTIRARIAGMAVTPVVFAPPFSPVVLCSISGFFNQFGVFLHLQTPSTAIG